jgi:hypothetical protein
MKHKQIPKAIMAAVLLTSTFNLGSQMYRTYLSDLEAERAGVSVCKFGPSEDEASRFYIEIALLIAFVGSQLKGFKGTLLYMTGLLSVVATYILWWRYYFLLEKIAGPEIRYVHHIVYLYRATDLDLCIAASCLLVLIWELSALACRASAQPHIQRELK